MLRNQSRSGSYTSSSRRLSARAAILSAGVALIALPGTAQAQEITDRFWVQAAFFWPKVDTEIRIDNIATDRPGTDIDVEQDFDLTDRKSVPAFLAGARLGGGWNIVAEYFSLNRSGETVLARDIIVDDVTYPANATIESDFNSDVYRLSVGYSFLRGPDYELGGSLGVHATEFEFQLSGSGSVNGAPFASQVRRRSVLAPLPTIGIYGTYQIAPHVTLGGRIDFMSLGIDNFDGRLINAQANVVYRFTDNFGIGAGYRFVDYRVDVDKDNWVGRADYQFSGPNIFLQVGFR